MFALYALVHEGPNGNIKSTIWEKPKENTLADMLSAPIQNIQSYLEQQPRTGPICNMVSRSHSLSVEKRGNESISEPGHALARPRERQKEKERGRSLTT